jgi:hypothetical protein
MSVAICGFYFAIQSSSLSSLRLNTFGISPKKDARWLHGGSSSVAILCGFEVQLTAFVFNIDTSITTVDPNGFPFVFG